MILLAFVALLAQLANGVSGGPDIVLQSGHAANISALAFSADGKFLVSASEDSTLKLWDPNTGSEIRTLRGHSNIVTAVGLSRDGGEIVSASLDHTLRVWNAATGQQLAVFPGPAPAVYLLKMTPDASAFVTAETVASGTIVRIWDSKSGRQIRLIKRESAAVSNVVFQGSEMLIAEESGDEEGTGSLTAYSLQTGRPVQTHASLLCGASDDGKWIALDQSTEKQRRALVVDAVHERALVSFSGQVSRVVFSSNDEWLAYESMAGNSAVVRRTQGGGVKTIHGRGAEFSMLALSPEGRWLATAGADFSVHIWDVESGKLAHAVPGQYTPTAIAFSPDGRRVAVNGGGADLGNALQVWDIERRSQVAAPSLRHPVAGLAFSKDGAALAGSAPSLEIFDGHSMASQQKLNCGSEAVSSPAFSPSGKLIAANCGGFVTLWSLSGGAEPFHFGEKFEATAPLLFSPDGRYLAAASANGVLLYDVAARKISQSINIKGANAVSALAFSNDGGALAFGTRLNAAKAEDPPLATLFLYDVRSHRKEWEVAAGPWVSALQFEREGHVLLAAAGEDLHKPGSLEMFEVASGRLLQKRSMKIPAGAAAAFSPNGEWLAAGWNSATWLWRVPAN